MLDVAKIHEAIDRFILTNPTEEYTVKIEKDDRQRPYLGLSQLGHECRKYLFLSFRHCFKPTFPSRIHRLFRRGDLEEYRFMWLLRGIGFTIYEGQDGKQFSVSDYENHVRGNLDGVGEAPDEFWIERTGPDAFLLEYKTASEKKFEECRKQGVEKWNPKYYIQMQTYCGYMGLSGALFCIVNKNTDELYFEWVPALKSKFRKAVEKAGDIVSATEPPQGISNNPSWYGCKYCDAWDVCHGGKESQKMCRTCKWATPAEAGSWECGKGKKFGEVCKEWKDIARCS